MQTSVIFYLPCENISDLPRSSEEYWDWQINAENLSTLWGHYHWVLQTFLFLRESEFSCSVTNVFPDEGIVLTHIDLIPRDIRPRKNLFVVGFLVDRGVNFDYADLYVSHSPVNRSVFSETYFHRVRHILPWPQINLIPRSPSRGNKFENIVFVGNEEQLAPELKTPEFANKLNELSLNWRIQDRKKWNDFSDIDAIVAIRSFDNNDYKFKPGLKLINAWLAGVPSILGPEFSYRDIGESRADYIEANSVGEVIDLLKELKNNDTLRAQIVNEGVKKSEKFTVETNTILWENLIQEIALNFVPKKKQDQG